MSNDIIKSNLLHLAKKLEEVSEELENCIDLDETEDLANRLKDITKDLKWMDKEIS